MDWIVTLNAVLLFFGIVGTGFLAAWCWSLVRRWMDGREEAPLR